MPKVDIVIIPKSNPASFYYPIIKDEVKWETERTGTPGKLTFTVVKDENISFLEGDTVQMLYDGMPLFYGFVFVKKRDKEHHIEVTAYDQIRYMKNKYTYQFQNVAAENAINQMCQDYGITVGYIEPMGYTIPNKIFENKSLLDIANEIMQDVNMYTGQMYVMYDDFGTLRINNLANMKTSYILDGSSMEDFSYETSIDKETYNEIVLYYKDEETKALIPCNPVPKDEANIAQWGLLRYFEEVDDPELVNTKARSLLELYNARTRTLKLEGVLGIPELRAGNMVVLYMDLGDMIASNYVLIEKLTHTFKEEQHTMEIEVNANWREG